MSSIFYNALAAAASQKSKAAKQVEAEIEAKKGYLNTLQAEAADHLRALMATRILGKFGVVENALAATKHGDTPPSDLKQV